MRKLTGIVPVFIILCLSLTQRGFAFDSRLSFDWIKPVASTIEPAAPLVPLPTPTPAFIADVIVDAELTPQRLTEHGCCVLPRWTTDSEWILFIDRPDPDSPTGIYGIPTGGGEAALVSSRIGIYSSDFSLVAYLESGQTFIERWVDGTRWTVPTQGRAVNFSPDNELIAWEQGSRAITDPDLRQQKIWISNLDGSGERELVTVHGGGFVGWTEGGESFLVTGRLSPPDPAGIWRISSEDGAGRLLMEVVRPRSILISPEGNWTAFLISFEPDSNRNGLWVVRVDGSELFKLPVAGSYRWRREGELLIIPYEGAEHDPYLLQFNLQEGDVYQLTEPEHHSLPISNNDWEPAPDGSRIVFLSAEDGNLWLLPLPEP